MLIEEHAVEIQAQKREKPGQVAENQVPLIVPKRKRCAGFTLIEVVAVTAMLGILAAMVMPSVEGANDKAKNAKLKSDLTTLDNAIQLYKLEGGSYPNELSALQPGYIAKGKVYKDAKNVDLVYSRDDKAYKLSGKLADGKELVSDGSSDVAGSETPDKSGSNT